jgi:putative protease
MVRLPELLSPAGDWESLRAAVVNGADAVYLGGKDFSARQYAANFSAEEMAEAVRFCHLRGVKVYVAVNTLIAPEEFGRALDYLGYLARLGVDGVLVQDLGLASAARQELPQLPLHASTQMTIHNEDGVRFLRRWGFSRVVLARELSLEDIRRIRAVCPEVELEVFVHGALCFSYSGQCLLSSFVGARSGNRGRCAQPCRLRYRLRGEQLVAEGHLLSTRDLNAISLIPELVAAGVAAFKIEGRMKRAEYVATVTRIYRQALDRYAADPQSYRPTEEELRELAQTFNREFTTGYLLGNPGRELMSYQRPNNRGVYLGRVVAISGDLAAVDLDGVLRVGDGVEFWVTRGGRRGLVVREILRDGRKVEEAGEGDRVWLARLPGVSVGDRVFKTSDRVLLERARASYLRTSAAQTIPLSLWVSGEVGKPLRIAGWDDRGNQVKVETEVECQPAEKHPLSGEVLAAQLGRLGGTAFYLRDLRCDLQGGLMVPLSSLNAARRRLVAEMEGIRLEKARPYPAPAEGQEKKGVRRAEPPAGRTRRSKLPKIAVAVADPSAAIAALASGADRLYLVPEGWQDGVGVLSRWREVAEAAQGKEVFPALPRFWHPTERDYLQEVLEAISALRPQGLLVPGPAGWEVAASRFPGASMVADYTFNVFNGDAAEFLLRLGFEGVTFSPELNLRQLRLMAPLAAVGGEIIVHGNFPLISSFHCLAKAAYQEGEPCRGPCRREEHVLEDRLGYRFPVRFDRRCRTYIFNSRELCLLSELPRLVELEPLALRLELRRAGAQEVAAVVEAYRRCLDAVLSGGASSRWLAEEEARLLGQTGASFTRGHYFRGV